MKKTTKYFLITILVTLLITISIGSYGVYLVFFDMGRLPKGELISEIDSLNGDYVIKAYLVESSLSASAIRGELNYNKVKKKPKNIYWGYRESSVNVKWIDNVTVIINGKKLNVLDDVYDWRREQP